MRAVRVTEKEYRDTHVRLWGREPAGPTGEVPEKPHKYKAKKVRIDGYTFASKWEGACYIDLKWQCWAGLITEPLLQVRFSLGVHYGRERVYVADFAFLRLDCDPPEFVVADAKGMRTPEYTRKKKVFEQLYQMPITELMAAKRRRKTS